MLRTAPFLIAVFLFGPVVAGTLGVLLPSLGYFPALGHETLGLDAWRWLLDWPGLARSIFLSLALGLVTAGISLVLTFLFLASFAETRAFVWLRQTIAPLLAVPHAAAAFAFAFLIAPSGLLARLFSPWATGWSRPPDLLIVQDEYAISLMAGLIVKEVPFLLLMALAPLAQIRAAERLRLARSLGYARYAAWFKTVVPALYPMLRLPVFAVIAYASANVDIALILGPVAPPPLAVQILRWANDPDLEHRMLASAAAMLQFLVTAAAIALWWAGERAVRSLSGGWLVNGGRSAAESFLKGLGRSLFPALVVTAALGVAALALNAFARVWRFPDALPARWTLGHWERVGASALEPVNVTLLIAVLSTGLSVCLVLAYLERERRVSGTGQAPVSSLLYLPLLVPQVGFLFGLVLCAELFALDPGLTLVVLGHVVFVLPYVYLSLAASYRRHDPAWDRVALTLGHGNNAVFWRVRLPMLLTPLLTAFAVGAAVSIGQYLATRLLGAGRIETVTTEAISLAAGGDRRLIGAWALTQSALPILFFAVAVAAPRLIWRRRRGMLGLER